MNQIEDIESKAREVLIETLKRAGDFQQNAWTRRSIGFPSDPGYDVSLVFTVGQGGGRGEDWEIQAVVKKVAHPKQVRQAIWELKRHPERASHERPVYPVLIAPFLSPEATRICEEEGVGYLDFSGNCFIEFGGIWIHFTGNKNKYKEERSLKNLYATKSARILRLLLQGPLVGHKVEDLAKRACVSLGLVSKIRRHLLDHELAKDSPDGMRVTFAQAHQILSGWLRSDDLEKRTERREYALLEINPVAIARDLSRLLDERSTPHAYTQWFAGWLRAPHVIPPIISVYVQDFPDEAILKNELNASRVRPRAGRLRLLKSNDYQGVILGGETIKDFPLVSDIQIYLDLEDAGQHGSEQARYLRETKDFSGGWL